MMPARWTLCPQDPRYLLPLTLPGGQALWLGLWALAWVSGLYVKLGTGTPLERTCWGAEATPRTATFRSCRPAPSLLTCTSSFTMVFWPRRETENRAFEQMAQQEAPRMGPLDTHWGGQVGTPARVSRLLGTPARALGLTLQGTGGHPETPGRAPTPHPSPGRSRTHIPGPKDDLCVGPTLQHPQALPIVPEELASGLPARGQGHGQRHGLLAGLRGCEARALGTGCTCHCCTPGGGLQTRGGKDPEEPRAQEAGVCETACS